MANHPSAEKRHRQSLKRRKRNRDTNGEVKSWIKKVSAEAENGNIEVAESSMKTASHLLDKAVVRGILHKNNAKRRISRLQKKLNSLAKAS